MSETHGQRRRRQSVFRPRHTKNDVNTGALGQHPAEAQESSAAEREREEFTRTAPSAT